MRLLLAQNTVYLPTFGGANKSNRLLMEALAGRGHECRVVAPATTLPQHGAAKVLCQELHARDIDTIRRAGTAIVFELNGVQIHAVTERADLALHLRTEATTFEPDWILVSSEDPGQNLLDASIGTYPSRVIYLARTTLALPCGPDAAAPNALRTSLLRRATGVVAISEYIQRYLKRWAEIEAVHLPVSLFGSGPFPNLARFDNAYVTMINPCALKGISIFLDLADRFPDWQFAAVPTWGTTRAERAALVRRSNVTLLSPSDRVEDILAQTRAVVVPSLWAEARGRIIMESMLHGIPVLASDVGGIAEAKLGVDYLLPVNPITNYDCGINERMLPVPEVPPQPVDAWSEALDDLLSSRLRYEDVSRLSREAASADAERHDVRHFETYLHALMPRGAGAPRATDEGFSGGSPVETRV